MFDSDVLQYRRPIRIPCESVQSAGGCFSFTPCAETISRSPSKNRKLPTPHRRGTGCMSCLDGIAPKFWSDWLRRHWSECHRRRAIEDHWAVPLSERAGWSRVCPVSATNPISASLGVPSMKMMFEGLMSRWIKPCLCRWLRAALRERAIRKHSSTGNRRRTFNTWERVLGT